MMKECKMKNKNELKDDFIFVLYFFSQDSCKWVMGFNGKNSQKANGTQKQYCVMNLLKGQRKSRNDLGYPSV